MELLFVFSSKKIFSPSLREILDVNLGLKKNTLVSGNAGDEKLLHKFLNTFILENDLI